MSDIYLFPTFVLNSNEWYYLCTIRLILNKVEWFKCFAGQKENHFNLFDHVFCWVDPMRHKWMLLFWQRNKDNPQRVFSFQERSWVRNLSVWYIFSYCLIVNNAHISLYIVFNSNWVIKKAWKKEYLTQNVFLRYLGLDTIYKCFIYFILNILSLSCIISVMFFMRVVWKLSLDLKPRLSLDWVSIERNPWFEILLLSRQWKALFAQWLFCASCFGKYSHDGNEEWIQCPALCQQWFNEP